MAETARIHYHEPPAVAVAKPALQIVLAPAVDAEADSTEPNVGRSGMIGYVIGFVTVAVGITLVGTLGGLGFGDSLGLGAFVGIWGGGGFGFMLGVTIPFARYLDAQSAHSTHH